MGGMTVSTMLASMSSAELTDWMAYERISGPLGPARSDLQAGIISAVIANVNRGKGKKYKPKDFIPEWDRPKAQTPGAMATFLKALTRKMGGRIRGGDE